MRTLLEDWHSNPLDFLSAMFITSLGGIGAAAFARYAFDLTNISGLGEWLGALWAASFVGVMVVGVIQNADYDLARRGAPAILAGLGGLTAIMTLNAGDDFGRHMASGFFFFGLALVRFVSRRMNQTSSL